MSREHTKYVLFGVAALILVVVAFYGGSQCNSGGAVLVGIDAGPGEQEILDRLERLERQAQQEIERIEARHREQIREFDDEQQREYDDVREQGPTAVAEWLSDFNRDLKLHSDAGTGGS
jgi:hypothetical protein